MENQISPTWGTALWSILHHCTERIGTIPLSDRQMEQNVWKQLLDYLKKSLPCIKCRTHYTMYYERKGPPEVKRESIRRWLYDLHSDVNVRLQKPNLPYEVLEGFYAGPFSFKENLDIIEQQGKIALRLKWYTAHQLKQFLTYLKHLQHMYSLA